MHLDNCIQDITLDDTLQDSKKIYVHQFTFWTQILVFVLFTQAEQTCRGNSTSNMTKPLRVT